MVVIPYPRLENSVKLVLMRGRIGFAWAIAASVGLALLLVLACHPGFVADTPTGMSAPSAPAAAIELASGAQLPQSQSDWNGFALRALSLSFALAAFCATHDARQDAKTDPPHYGPLHRRPPPRFS